MQPMKRFNLDPAMFSDILMVPTLWVKVDFKKDSGPILENFNLNKFMDNDKSLYQNFKSYLQSY